MKTIELLRSMLLQRRFEERCAEAYALGRIGGFCHLYIGQEAVSTGTLSVLRADDYVITTYRDHGQALARGVSPRAMMAELFPVTSRATGMAVSYNIGVMTFGGTTPLVVVWLVDATGSKLSLTFYLMFLAVLSLVCVVFARRRLDVR